jgi:hypothetical protein
MKKVLFLLLLICTSCSTVYRFSVDIQEPAQFTLPLSAQNVLILNNAVAQPIEYGVERTFDGKPIRTDFPLSLDSMIWTAIEEIAAVFNESHFFNTVAVYKESLRKDTEWLTKGELSPENQSQFYNETEYDALFVIDRLLFTVAEKVKRAGTFSPYESFASIDLKTNGLISCSLYSHEKEKPLTSFSISDSLTARPAIDDMIVGDSIDFFKNIPEYVLRELAHILGNRAATHFVPTWKTEERTLFTGYNSRMQEATGNAANRQWANAESIWLEELRKKTKPIDKAKISFNLAVANEMQDRFNAALRWAQNAKEYLKDTGSGNSQETELMDKYISGLEKRIQNNRLLDLQWGKSE